MTASEQAVLSQISRKLDQILAFLAVRDVEDEGDKIRRLRGLGIDNATIAAVTGLSKNAVAVRVHRMRRNT